MGDKSEAVMTARQAAELDHALARNGLTAEDVKWLSGGNRLAEVIKLRDGRHAVLPVSYRVDLDAPPFVPENWELSQHQGSGIFEWGASCVQLYQTEGLKLGLKTEFHALRVYMIGNHIGLLLNANLLDFLLEHQELIPDEWKEIKLHFFGTLYITSRGKFAVRILFWRGDKWVWTFHEDDIFFDKDDAVAIRIG